MYKFEISSCSYFKQVILDISELFSRYYKKKKTANLYDVYIFFTTLILVILF